MARNNTVTKYLIGRSYFTTVLISSWNYNIISSKKEPGYDVEDYYAYCLVLKNGAAWLHISSVDKVLTVHAYADR